MDGTLSFKGEDGEQLRYHRHILVFPQTESETETVGALFDGYKEKGIPFLRTSKSEFN